MKRREFIVLLGAAGLGALAVRAQQKPIPVIGILAAASPDNAGALRNLAAFREGLGEFGYVDGQNIAIEYRWAAGHFDRLPALAAELIDRKVDVIVTEGGDPSVLAAKQATSTIPVVFHTDGDPVAGGFVAPAIFPGGTMPESQIVVDAKGTYAGKPITGHLVGGAPLSLNDAQRPYPVDLKLVNGATHVSLAGTLIDPLTFAGADLKLELSGADMRDLYHLTGIPIPETPAYSIAGQLDYADHKFRLRGFRGVVGSSDLRGSIEEDVGQDRPMVTADLTSTKIDLADLGGFVGTTPSRLSTPNQSAPQKRELARAEASSKLLPDTPINLPQLRTADVKLRYRGEHIVGRSVPLDNLAVNLSIIGGKVILEPISFGVGRGRIAGTIVMDGSGDVIHAKAAVDLEHVDVARLMAATHLFGGAGAIGGHLDIVTSGNSLAQFLGNGDGGLRLLMTGGDLSALLVDLSGLELGNAILSSLGMPERTPVECMISDFALQKGLLNTRTFLLVTKEANVHGAGWVNLRNETMDLKLNTTAAHFSIGSLHTPIHITGPLKSPGIRPEVGELMARGGIAGALGVVMPPLAILGTIEFGKDESRECAARISSVSPSDRAKAAPTTGRAPARRRGR